MTRERPMTKHSLVHVKSPYKFRVESFIFLNSDKYSITNMAWKKAV